MKMLPAEKWIQEERLAGQGISINCTWSGGMVYVGSEAENET